jgi:hypothetical protein
MKFSTTLILVVLSTINILPTDAGGKKGKKGKKGKMSKKGATDCSEYEANMYGNVQHLLHTYSEDEIAEWSCNPVQGEFILSFAARDPDTFFAKMGSEAACAVELFTTSWQAVKDSGMMINTETFAMDREECDAKVRSEVQALLVLAEEGERRLFFFLGGILTGALVPVAALVGGVLGSFIFY